MPTSQRGPIQARSSLAKPDREVARHILLHESLLGRALALRALLRDGLDFLHEFAEVFEHLIRVITQKVGVLFLLRLLKRKLGCLGDVREAGQPLLLFEHVNVELRVGVEFVDRLALSKGEAGVFSQGSGVRLLGVNVAL